MTGFELNDEEDLPQGEVLFLIVHERVRMATNTLNANHNLYG